MRGVLSLQQMRAVREVVKGRVVTDLGAGTGRLSIAMVGLGATEVIAVDQEIVGFGTLPQIRPVLAQFRDYHEEIDVALVSWPEQFANHGLTRLAASAETVIYLGTNMGGTVCAPMDFWQVFRFREVLVHLPHYKNTLIIYGKKEVTRPLMPEEFAALNMEKIWSFEELYGNRGEYGSRGSAARTH